MKFLNYSKLKTWYFILGVFFAVTFFLLLLSSCPPPLTEDIIKEVKDALGPIITISSPTDRSSYAATVVVQGTVEDVTTEDGDQGRIKVLSYEVLSAGIGDIVEFNDSGNFSFQFSSDGLSGSITISITAEDANGNTTTESITLVNEGAIPSFSLTPGIQSVTLTWDDVPLSSSYSVYYTTNGSFPTDQNGIIITNVTSPYTLSNLQNGNLHVFMLKSYSTTGNDNTSDYISAIPLSTMTLAPNITEGNEDLTIEWNQISGEDTFKVWRRSENESTLSYYTIVTGNSFTDTNVSEEITYYYAISPETSDEIISETVSGEIWPFLDGSDIYKGSVSVGGGGNVVTDTAYYNNHVYTVDPDAFTIIDVSYPDMPVIRKEIIPTVNPETYKPKGIVIYDSLAVIMEYFAPDSHVTDSRDNKSAIRIYDLSDPSNPVEIGSKSWDGNRITPEGKSFTKLDTDGSYVYTIYQDISSTRYYLKIIDIQDKTAPTDVSGGILALPDKATDIVVDGNYAYIIIEDTDGSSDGGIYIYDVYNAGNPSLVSGGTYTSALLTRPERLYVSDDVAYITDFYDGLTAIDVSNTGSPGLLGHYDPGGTGGDVKVLGDIAYFAAASEGLYVLDISDPASINVLRNYDFPSQASCVSVSDERMIYAIDYLTGLRIFDLKMPSFPELIGSLNTSCNSLPKIEIEGKYAYIAASSNGLRIVDISVPNSPSEVGSYPSESTNAVKVRGDLAFLADFSSGLVILDVSNRNAPQLLSNTGSDAADLDIAGDYVYVITGYDFLTYDISDPTAPVQINRWDFDGGRYMEKASNYLAFFDYTPMTDMYIFDISVKSLPVKTGNIQLTSDNTFYIDSYKNYFYIGGNNHGLHIIDFSTPSVPVETTAYNTSGINFRGIKTIGDYAFIGNQTTGLRILYLGDDPASPVEDRLLLPAGSVDPDSVKAIDVRGNYLYYTENSTGHNYIRIMRLYQ